MSFDNDTAMATVLDNLGMDGPEDLNNDLETGNESDFNENETGDDQDTGDDRVSHTEDRQQQQRQPNRQQQQRDRNQPQQQQPRQLPRNAEVQPDQRGNLVDRDGKIVAKAGMEARLYQDLHRTRGAFAQEQARTAEVTTRLTKAIDIGQRIHNELQTTKQQLQELQSVGKRLNLADAEQMQALQFAAEMKTDPAGAIRRILTMAATRGVDLTKIGIPAGGLDPKALSDLIKEQITQAMNPLKERSEQERQQQVETERMARERQEADTQVETFFQRNPDARQHLAIFQAIYEQPQFANMSLGEAWARIQLNQARQPTQQTQGRQQLRSRAIPSGQRREPGRAPANDMADVNESYDAILREVMEDVA